MDQAASSDQREDEDNNQMAMGSSPPARFNPDATADRTQAHCADER